MMALYLTISSVGATGIFVSPSGNDQALGTQTAPFGTLQKARDAARQATKPVTIQLAGGTHYLPETLLLTPVDSQVTWQAVDGEIPVISGGVKLDLKWQPYSNGILQAQVPADVQTEEIFVNGERQILARYPNFDPKARYFDGSAADAIAKERVARWADPAGGYFHAMHPALWGGFTWRITGKNLDGEVELTGGWQNNRGGAIHKTIRFVENIFEELDAPGEWFLNTNSHTLYFHPPAGFDPANATVEVTRLTTLVELRGTESNPVRAVTIKGLTFRHANRTMMETKEPLLRTDWAIYRGGAILFNGTTDCLLQDSLIDQVGGNAVFANNFNRRITIRGCEIAKAGASGIVFLGDYAAIRNPLFNHSQRQKLSGIDQTPGPKSNNYPADCLVDDCLIYLTGRVEKQTAGVNIDVAQNITVRHCTIHDMPRAGINIGDGCWGGHLIEACDVFDTVKETGDHGSFNSWGRDRYWKLGDVPENQLPHLALLDAVKPTILRNNRWRCDHGWDIDLDDGSSNYEITNNLCLGGGLKLREGFHRRVTNNITINNSLHPHVWYADCRDVVTRNIFMKAYRPAIMKTGHWGKEIDYNLFTTTDADRKAHAADGCDAHSLTGDPLFIEPAQGDFRVRPESPALKLGFQNFPMDQFGVQKPSLKARAAAPVIPPLAATAAPPAEPAAAVGTRYWIGASLHTIEGQEFSAFGVSKDDGGVQLQQVSPGSLAAGLGFQKDDLIQAVNQRKTPDVAAFCAAMIAAADAPLSVQFSRSQKSRTVSLPNAPFVLMESADVLYKVTDK